MRLSAAMVDAMVAAGASAQEIADAYKAHILATEADKEAARAADRRREVSGGEWESLRWTVFRRDKETCTYCGARDVPLECDHIVPLCQGGSYDLSNLTTACKPCNSSKRHRTPQQWRAAQ